MVTIEFKEARYAKSAPDKIRLACLDSPRTTTRQKAAGVEFAGWILGQNEPVACIEVTVNSVPVHRLPVNRLRRDVGADHSDLSWAENSGFMAHVNLTGADPDVIIDMFAVFADESRVYLGGFVAERRSESLRFLQLSSQVRADGVALAERKPEIVAEPDGAGAPPPVVSIVVPVHNQSALTKQCLDALLTQGEAPPFEIIVVDDASSDDTAELLGSYAGLIRIVSLAPNRGFAGACNAGADIARGQYILFLNNDTVPEPGWLTALVREAEANPEAAVIGAKLLFPDDTIQHAGVAIGTNGYPHHIYAGFPGDHPVVNVSRRFQIVTAACCLVRSERWQEVGGFDTGYRNGWEDIDFCLRLGEAGHQVRYCHESVVYHLESASRDPSSPSESHNKARFEETWIDRVDRDSIGYYIEDKLLRMIDQVVYPLVAFVSPELAVMTKEYEETVDLMVAEHADRIATLEMTVAQLSEQLAAAERRLGTPVESPAEVAAV